MSRSRNLLHTPVCAVAGGQDRMVKHAKVERLIDELNRHGGRGNFVLLPGARHGDTCRLAFRPSHLRCLYTSPN